MAKKTALPDEVKVYLTEKDAAKREEKRTNFMFVLMLEGLAKMLEVWGDFECKNSGCVDPVEQLYHCHACTWNGIKNHVDQGIRRWKARA